MEVLIKSRVALLLQPLGALVAVSVAKVSFNRFDPETDVEKLVSMPIWIW